MPEPAMLETGHGAGVPQRFFQHKDAGVRKLAARVDHLEESRQQLLDGYRLDLSEHRQQLDDLKTANAALRTTLKTFLRAAVIHDGTEHDVGIMRQKGHSFLWIDGTLWMWDVETERRAQKALAADAAGDVLVVGYGLGIVQQYLLEMPRVESVRTVELIPEVVTENLTVFGRIYGDVMVGDFYDMAEAPDYDCIIGDIWEDIVEPCLAEYVEFKEKALALLKPGGKLLAWGQEFFEYLLEKKRKGGDGDETAAS